MLIVHSIEITLLHSDNVYEALLTKSEIGTKSLKFSSGISICSLWLVDWTKINNIQEESNLDERNMGVILYYYFFTISCWLCSSGCCFMRYWWCKGLECLLIKTWILCKYWQICKLIVACVRDEKSLWHL